jgi:hypothetical protein
LGVEAVDEVSNEFAHGIAPIVLPRPADEISGGIMNAGADFTLSATAMHRDVEGELSDPRSDSHGAAEPGHQLPLV